MVLVGLQRPFVHARPVQQSAVAEHGTVSAPQEARQRSAGAVVVPRQFGYAAQQSPRVEQASPEAQTFVPASITPASGVPASVIVPASVMPASGVPASVSTPASFSPPSGNRIGSQANATHVEPTPHTWQAPPRPQALASFPLRQTPSRVQPPQDPASLPLLSGRHAPKVHVSRRPQALHWAPARPHAEADGWSSHAPSALQQPAQVRAQSEAGCVGPHPTAKTRTTSVIARIRPP